MKNEMELKEELFNELFESRVKRYKQPVDRKYVDVVMVCKNASLQNFFMKLYKKYQNFSGMTMSVNDFMEECIYHTWIAIVRFNIRDEGSWGDMISGEDTANMGRLVRAIKNTVEPEIARVINDGAKYTTKTEEGTRKHITNCIEFSSTDQLIGGQGSSTSTILIDLMTEDSNFFAVKEGYQKNQFTLWFLENKKRILTKSQYSLLRNLEKIGFDPLGERDTDLAEVIGFPTFKLNTTLERIGVRVLKAWEKEKPLEETQLQKEVKREVNIWTNAYLTIEDNKQFSNWIINNLEKDEVSNLVYDRLDLEDSYEIVKVFNGELAQISSPVLYRIFGHIEVRLEQLKAMDTKSVPFSRHPEEACGGWTKEKHVAYSKYLKDFKEQPCYVYNSEGELVGELPHKYFKASSTVHYKLNAYGTKSISDNI